MSLETIQTYCRLRPADRDEVKYVVKGSDSDSNNNDSQSTSSTWDSVDFLIDSQQVNPFSPSKEKRHSFMFRKVFDQDSTQEEVFEHAAKPVLDNILNGFNGTIFTYGQTATGKTYTIVGEEISNLESTDKGIVPRSISYLFDTVREDEERGDFTVEISYLEIYKDVGYDLLSGSRDNHKVSKLDDMKLVISRTDARKKLHLVNLSTHVAKTKDEALELFVKGSENRVQAETSVNDASSRSHCVFTMELRIRETEDSVKVRKSKLNFVDLAGSERVGKSHNSDRGLLAEARNINLSLHHLQQVIVALGKTGMKQNRLNGTRNQRLLRDKHVHVPYRNTMITSVLRGSLGGNCRTTMIATLSVENNNIKETLSTCQFAQRVARVKNRAVVNESADLGIVVARLEEENRELRSKLREATTSKIEEPLTDDEMQTLYEIVTEYLASEDGDVDLEVIEGAQRIQFCYRRMKEYAMANKQETKKKKRKGLFGS